MNYENITPDQWTRWKKKRRSTFMGYLLVGVMVGIDYSFMFTTLYLYLEQMIKTPNPRLVICYLFHHQYLFLDDTQRLVRTKIISVIHKPVF